MNLRQEVSLTRGRLIAMAFGLGLLGAAGIVLGYIALDNVSENRRERIAREGLTAAQVEQIARRVFRLERPSRKEIVQRLRAGLPLCRTDATCARELREIANGITAPPASTAPRAPAPRRKQPRRPQARTNPPPRTQRPGAPAPRPPPPPGAPPLVDPPPLDPDGPGGIPPIDLPPIQGVPRLCDSIPIPGVCARMETTR